MRVAELHLPKGALVQTEIILLVPSPAAQVAAPALPDAQDRQLVLAALAHPAPGTWKQEL